MVQGDILEGELAMAAAEIWEEAKQAEQRTDHGTPIVPGAEPTNQPLGRRPGFWRRTGNKDRLGRDGDLLQEIKLLEDLAGAQDYTGQRLVGHRHRQLGFLAQHVVQTWEQRPAARQYDAGLDNIRGDLGRRSLETGAHRFDNGLDRLAQGLANLLVRDEDRLRNPVDQITAFDLHRAARAPRGRRRAQGELDLFGAALPDEQVIVLANVLHDGLVHLVARDPHRLAVHDAGQRDDRHLRRASADINDDVAVRLLHGDPCPDGGGHRLFDEVHLAGAALHSG